jgi:hypothetical protein
VELDKLIIALTGIVVGALFSHYFTSERDKLARELAERDKQRESARAVAEILGEWVKSSYVGETNEGRWQLQVTYWRNMLALDRELVTLLFPRLALAKDAPSTHDVLVEARRVLLGLSKRDLEAGDLNHWDPVPTLPPLAKEQTETAQGGCGPAE